jgi:RNA polymerase sigma-70 factor (ECF subfamily)
MDEEPLYDVDWNEGEQKLDAEALFDLLKSLPAMTEKVFNLYAIDGFKHKEIAEMLAISEGTSKWHVSDARKRLKLALDEAEIKDTRKLELNIKLK